MATKKDMIKMNKMEILKNAFEEIGYKTNLWYHKEKVTEILMNFALIKIVSL